MPTRARALKAKLPEYKATRTILVHGIMTSAKWQKIASEVLSDQQIPFKHYDFGKYGIHKFLFRRENDRMVEKCYHDYGDILREYGSELDVQSCDKRPSVIAHSFGTYLVGCGMLKYEEMCFDKVIFCGSVLPLDFDWGTLFRRNQVNRVLNEYSTKDFWAGITGKFVPNTGPAGAKGFHVYLAGFEEKSYELRKHSDYFDPQHIKQCWIPFLRKKPSRFEIKHGREFSDDSEFGNILNYTSAVIDAEAFAGLPHFKEAAIPRGLSLKWIGVCPDIYTFLMDRDTQLPVGYINAMPVTDATFGKLKAGNILEKEITGDDLNMISPGASLKLFIMSVAIRPMARNVGQGLFHEAVQKLINGLLDKLIHYADLQGVRVSEIASIGWTTEGRKLSGNLGMTEVAKDCFGNPVYWAKLDLKEMRSKQRLLPALGKLLDHYEQLPAT